LSSAEFVEVKQFYPKFNSQCISSYSCFHDPSDQIVALREVKGQSTLFQETEQNLNLALFSLFPKVPSCKNYKDQSYIC
jgi:hypothetical protein